MKSKIIRFSMASFTMSILLVSAVTVGDFVAPIFNDHGLSNAYAMWLFRDQDHRYRYPSGTSPTTAESGEDASDGNASDGNPTFSVPEPSTLILLGSAMAAVAGLCRKIKRRGQVCS
ncbi:MAG: PEP-CTERM sorting domain-containing protein [candidate division Zixibacteria bacterium]|nr:PEP-CTERM sorting domain-containing protein [candidate division Zixibacteria bacterium]